MEGPPKGRTLALSPARKIVCELMHHARNVPNIAFSRLTQVGPLLDLRQKAGISWTVLYLKAFALLAREQPTLRQLFVQYPWPRLYEHAESVASVLIAREHQGEKIVLGARFRSPDRHSLAQMQKALDFYRSAPVEEVNYFRQLLRVGRLPALLRRFVFWHSIHLSGYWCAKRFGTFVISNVGGSGAETDFARSFVPNYLGLGPVEPDGRMRVTLIFDHRIYDGQPAAFFLSELEKVLLTAIADELKTLVNRQAA